eukprot:CAMPEP_0177505286 /NCGR_PEP_ID=MMETSP0369-20130122/39327_1 /TAXON_ID=447022 ORGANISM="Scrippsiella hangoei-like, Strain SHHI-4" /NCGR_SAMPLE_ID=MMETSP0369 /ASSEMBLY_ACC=CAM_ASM_000364 /LENGTH=107 /DNA_ID=CAMNT_0018983149 /DNA_START=599 /DNA_END=918 /DNA_ORIENTATION=+
MRQGPTHSNAAEMCAGQVKDSRGRGALRYLVFQKASQRQVKVVHDAARAVHQSRPLDQLDIVCECKGLGNLPHRCEGDEDVGNQDRHCIQCLTQPELCQSRITLFAA